ncbi:MAG: hypothetical protein IT324_07690 [Anaerolineae bacterium]|nr:hypothetical protein [Anaerolineae bacterium]
MVGLKGFFKQLCDRVVQAEALRDELDDAQTSNQMQNAVAALRHHVRANDPPVDAFLVHSALKALPNQV